MEKYQLPKGFATKWLTALRSGEYVQTTGIYFDRNTSCHCSIGVGLEASNLLLGSNSAIDGADYKLFETDLINGKTLWSSIVELNDEQNLSFIEIAEWIENNVEFI